MERVKVLYIAGAWRSGSTILDNILGQIDGFFSGGEMFATWKRGVIENRLCGCGTPFRECNVWRQVLQQAFGGYDQINAIKLDAMSRQIRTWYLPLMLLVPSLPHFLSRPKEYLEALERLFHAVQQSTGSRVIVDSSKAPMYGQALGMIPSIDLYVVHLIRDPRAVAYSWSQHKKYQPDADELVMLSHGPLKTSLSWNLWNMLAHRLWSRQCDRYMLLRYEDLMRNPQETIKSIIAMVNEQAVNLPFTSEREVLLGVNHTVSGNPDRFHNGRVKLRLDDEWRRGIKLSNYLLVTLLTWPLLLRYGYACRQRGMIL